MKSLITNSLLFVFSFIFAFIFFEGLANVFDITPRPLESLDLRSYRVSANPIIRYEYQPNYSSEQQPYDGHHQGFKINSIGFRDQERSFEKPANVKRILLLGDSTTAGNGVADYNKIYSKQLEDLLNRESRQIRYEVLNMAVGGYQTLQEVETLKEKGLRFKPDLVFIVLCLNDFSNTADGGVFARLKEVYQDKSSALDLRISNSILKRSRLAFALYHRLGFSEENNWQDDWYDKNALKGKNPVQAGFELLSQLQSENKFKAIVLILPEFKNTFDRYARYQDHENVKIAAQEAKGLTVIDLVKKFAEFDFNLKNFSFDTCHLNEKGHAAMAEILKPIVLKILPDHLFATKATEKQPRV